MNHWNQLSPRGSGLAAGKAHFQEDWPVLDQAQRQGGLRVEPAEGLIWRRGGKKGLNKERRKGKKGKAQRTKERRQRDGRRERHKERKKKTETKKDEERNRRRERERQKTETRTKK